MSRQKLSEFRAKSLLIDDYTGVSLSLESLQSDLESLDESTNYVVKVDQGVKKRGKQGLIRLNVAKHEVESAVKELAERGFDRFIAEPMLPHDESSEVYISFERVREGILLRYSEHGGVDVEDNASSIQEFLISDLPDNFAVDRLFVDHVVNVMNQEHLSFVEINPLVVKDNQINVLDAAVLVDSAGAYSASWDNSDIVESGQRTEVEKDIAELNENSTAAFSFKLLNADAAIWLLLSGGGASITIADEAHNQGRSSAIGDYGEYSGGPTTEETYLYTSAVLRQSFASHAQKKAIIIAGGVANFTDVKKTFSGILRAFKEQKDKMKSDNMKVFVRRGGPNEEEGLEMMKKYLKDNNLFGSVHGSDIVLTNVVHEALEYIDE